MAKMIDIDKIDWKILYELDMDARQGLSSLANKLRLSKQVVKYRIKRLEGLGIILGYYAVVDSAKLGYYIFRMYIALQDMQIETEKGMKEFFKKQGCVGWMVTLDGAWDIAALVWVKNAHDFENFKDEFIYRFGKCVREINIALITQIYNFSKIVLSKKNEKEFLFGENPELIETDELDLKILSALTKKGLINSVELASMLKVSSKTIRLRLKRLEKERIIFGYRADIDMKRLGYSHYKVFFDFMNITKDKAAKLMTFLRISPNVIYITKAIGKADIEFEVLAKTAEDFHEFMVSIRKEFAGFIKKHESVIVIKEEGINYLPIPIE